ncbi:MAG: DUF2256 and DUF3253 domain-containing protein [Planctomycetaceae bacterium]|jgi:hypothetical protein|nr:DUF2256 and DUF3253 domain-containing protein [Phycisphaerales bacterium]MCE2653909.1 DUF2256 and DUF3253 domain-containing protein [Planctomycetaceae bacterium]
MPDRPSKVCTVCGREIQWRKKWERDWENVKFCSDRCRRYTPSASEAGLEAAILLLLQQRAKGSTICPSEAARLVSPAGDTWRTLMEPARMAARRLVDQGRIVITQGGKVVDPSTAKGPIRLRLR